MSKYSTSAHNFIDKYTEKTYQPDAKLIEMLHAYLDMVAITNEQLALAIDMVVAQLMRIEGYGQPMHYRERHDNELIKK